MSIELKQAAQRALEVLEEIALAGMSGTGQESEEGMRDWHARQAWKFIGIATRALDPLHTAIQQAESEPVGEPRARVELMKTGGNVGMSTRIIELDIVTRERLRPGDLLYTRPAPCAPEAVAGELDPLRAYEFGQLITKYSESFNGQKWGGVYDSVDRKNLAVALDYLTEAGAMLMNISERLLRTNPAPAASVTDEQIAACVKRASTYGLPFVGLLNPGGTPSDFSKRFTAEILALRPVQVPMGKQDAWDNSPVNSDWEAVDAYLQGIEDAEAHHGITAQAKKETP